MKRFVSSLLLSTLLLFNGCGGGDSSTVVTSDNFTLAEKEFVHTLFLTEYLWYEDVPATIDYNAYLTPQSLVTALRVDPPDKWSFTITSQEYEDYVNQTTAGFGFGYTADFVIYLVRIDAPAWQKLQRGDRILALNGQSVTSDLLQSDSANLGTPATFTVERNGTVVDVTVTPSTYTFKVTSGSVITHNNLKIGYLRYDSFTSTSVTEIEDAYTLFKNENVSELVIDLRYNGGGSVTVASILLDNITNQHPGEKQFYLDWNANYKNFNEIYYFSNEIDANDLNMTRVFFLVTQNSASASELMISALKPYFGDAQVITIGDYTHGKNVGMQGRVYNDNYYFLINFYVRNSADETTSFDGIPPTCTAEDDLTHLRGDVNETMLQTALFYLDNGSCP